MKLTARIGYGLARLAARLGRFADRRAKDRGGAFVREAQRQATEAQLDAIKHRRDRR